MSREGARSRLPKRLAWLALMEQLRRGAVQALHLRSRASPCDCRTAPCWTSNEPESTVISMDTPSASMLGRFAASGDAAFQTTLCHRGASDATGDSFPADCGEARGCFPTLNSPVDVPCGAFNCSCQGFRDRCMASGSGGGGVSGVPEPAPGPSTCKRKAPANTHWFWEFRNCSSAPGAAAKSRG